MTLIEAVDSPIDLESRLADLARHKAPQNIQPNVLLITVDALRADHLGACGNRWIKTPSLDLLASYSIVSCNAYTQQPQTNPALASLLTSTYPSVHGVRMHMVDRLPDSFDTLAEILKRVGFTTAAVIPWTSLEPAFSGFHQGFDTYEAFVVNEPEVLRNPATAALAGVYRRVTDQLAVGSAVESVLGLRQGTEAEIDGRADVTAAASASWLSANAQSRFFLWVHYFDPHYPWTPPEPWDGLYDQSYDGPFDGSMQFIYEMREGVFRPDARDVQFLRAMYASEVSYADHYIGRMLGQMARMGLLENTIIVLTADHGESLGERGTSWPDGEYWLHGDDLYDPGVQIPFMVFDPRVATHQRLREPVQQIDVMPTILDLLRMPIPLQAQGKSIVPLAAGAESGVDRVAVSVLGNDSTTSIVSADGWKLVARRGGAPELYNLNTDPYERTNLVTSAPARALELAQRLDAVVQGNQQRISRAVADERPRG
jgi:arylsulfatase A-like enzyme